MNSHIKANLWLLGFTLVLCCVAYPLVLWGVGQGVFPEKANGSLIVIDGQVRGSRLIAQPFSGDEWFQPRPSAVSYNAAAAGGSNWGANNPKLRDRVARQLGPIVKYRTGSKAGQNVGPDIEAWFASQPDRVSRWATDYPLLAKQWVTSDKLNTAYVEDWMKQHADVVKKWKLENPGSDPKPEDLAGPFFEYFAKRFPAQWPSAVEEKGADGRTVKQIKSVKEGTDIQAIFFDSWLQAQPKAELETVRADLVMASGSGLDPCITLAAARSQLPRIAEALAKKTGKTSQYWSAELEKILSTSATAPLGGLVGEQIVNTMELNLSLQKASKGVGANNK